MAPQSQINGNGGFIGAIILGLGLAVSKATAIDYKTLLKICMGLVTLMAGWGVNHLINCMDRIDASQMAIVRSVGAIETRLSVSDTRNAAEFANLKKCIDDHITEYQNSIRRKP